MQQPIPRVVTPQYVDYMKDFAAAAEYDYPHDHIDNWLEEVYPTEISEDCFRSEGSVDVDPEDGNSVFDGQSHAQPTPTITARVHVRLNGRRAACSSFLAATSEVFTGSSQSEVIGSFDQPTTDTASRSYDSLVENPCYRDTQLALNKISLVDSRKELPSHISALIKSLTPDRVSILPSHEHAEDNNELLAMELEASKANVENFFRDNIVPRSSQDNILLRSDRIIISNEAMVSKMPNLEINTPIPGMLYGYNISNAFEHEQKIWIATPGGSACANDEGLLYPFMAVEFKGDGPRAVAVSGLQRASALVYPPPVSTLSRSSTRSFAITNTCLSGRLTAPASVLPRMEQKLVPLSPRKRASTFTYKKLTLTSCNDQTNISTFTFMSAI